MGRGDDHHPRLILPRRALFQGAGMATLAAAWQPTRAAVPEGPPKGQIIVGLSQEPTRFHPLRAHIEVDDGVHLNLFSALWRISPDGTFVPDLATEVPSIANGGISRDGLTWRVKLRSDVTWHDGAPFSAEDVKFTLDLIRNPNFPAMSRSGHNMVQDIKVLSPTELTWTMEQVYAPYFAILAWTQIVPKHVPGAAAEGQDVSFNNLPIGTGPFKWGERRPGDYVSLVANEKFYGDGPHVARLVFKYIPDMTGLKTQFVTGAIDVLGIAGITPDNLDEVKAVPGLKLYAAPSGYLTSFMFNNGLPVFQDPAVREALYLSMDKDAILNDIFYGNDIPTESYLPQQSWAYDPNLPKHVFDVAKANALLDQAGWKHGSDGIRKKNGVRLSFDCSTVAGNHLREQTQQFLQQGWQKIGAELSIKNYPAAVVWGDFWRKSQFQSTIVGAIFSIGSDPDASDRLGSWNIPVKTGTGSNTMQYANLEVDRLLHESVATLDQEKRRQNYWRVQELVRKDLPFLPIAQQKSTEGTKVKVQGYQPNINYRSNCWNARDWKWSA